MKNVDNRGLDNEGSVNRGWVYKEDKGIVLTILCKYSMDIIQFSLLFSLVHLCYKKQKSLTSTSMKLKFIREHDLGQERCPMFT